MRRLFHCGRCGSCCTDEILPISIFLGDLFRISISFREEIFSIYFQSMKVGLGLKYPCVYFSGESGCTIHQVKPLVCKRSPAGMLLMMMRGYKLRWPGDGAECCAKNDFYLNSEMKKQVEAIVALESKEGKFTDEYLFEGKMPIIDFLKRPEYLEFNKELKTKFIPFIQEKKQDHDWGYLWDKVHFTPHLLTSQEVDISRAIVRTDEWQRIAWRLQSQYLEDIIEKEGIKKQVEDKLSKLGTDKRALVQLQSFSDEYAHLTDI